MLGLMIRNISKIVVQYQTPILIADFKVCIIVNVKKIQMEQNFYLIIY